MLKSGDEMSAGETKEKMKRRWRRQDGMEEVTMRDRNAAGAMSSCRPCNRATAVYIGDDIEEME